MRKQLIPALLAAMIAAALPGCGDDSDIPKSENAPTQADFDAMKEMMNKSAKVKTPKKAD
ncbi:hypothetical protein [Paludisphaera soli]|uniref:hypothetical protein n=1 Tax=Paludisphaera soli TaxID=2712865 RepID=UPI0013ECD576|nr:hypothetical protein [Paludisphaera soli]